MFMLEKSVLCLCYLVIIAMNAITAGPSSTNTARDNDRLTDLTADIVDVKNIVTDNESHGEIDNNIDRKKKHRNRTRGVRWWSVTYFNIFSQEIANRMKRIQSTFSILMLMLVLLHCDESQNLETFWKYTMLPQQ